MIKNLRIHDQTFFLLGSAGILTGVFLTNIFGRNTFLLLFFVCIASIQILFFLRAVIPYVLVFIVLFCLGGYMSLERSQEIRKTQDLFEKETVFFTQNAIIKGTLTEKISEDDKRARYILRNLTLGTRELPSDV